MANSVLLPSLSELGWTDGSEAIADALLSHFFTAFYSQTYVYPDKVSSLQYILQKNQASITALTTEVQSALSSYFSRYFTDVVAECSEKTNTSDPNQQAISIFLTFTDTDGVSHNIADIVQYGDGTIQKVISVINS